MQEQAGLGAEALGAFFQLIFQPAVAKGSGLAFPPPSSPSCLPRHQWGADGQVIASPFPSQADALGAGGGD